MNDIFKKYQYSNKTKYLICDLGMPRIYLAKNATFTNCLSWLHHQAKGSSHVVGGMDNLINKDKFPMTSA
jgi:hypothetical protein